MKKIKFLSAIALTLVMASCDNFELPNPPAQSNPEPEAVFTDADIDLATATDAVNLIDNNDHGTRAVMATIEKLSNFPEGYELAVDMQVGNDSQFDNVVTLSASVEDNLVTVEPSLLNGAIREVITKTPGVINVPVRFAAYAVRDNTRARLGGLDKYFAQGLVSVRTFDPTEVIENNYYVVPFTADGTPEFNLATKMNNLMGEGLSGYDAPEFSLKVDVVPGQIFAFKIAPESAMAGAGDPSALFGANLTSAMGGKLDTSFEVITSPIEGSVLITINMELRSITFSYAFDCLYPFGPTPTIPSMILYTKDYITYSGVSRINRVFTLNSEPSKESGIIFMDDKDVAHEIDEENPTISGSLTVDPELGQTIGLPWTGNNLCYIQANLTFMTYFVKPIYSLSVIGQNDNSDANWNLEWSAANNTLAPNNDKSIWTGTDIEIGSEFKINANGAWDVDFGGPQDGDVLEQGVYFIEYKGKNMSCTPGKYDVKLDFSAYPYTLTLTKKN